MNTPQYLQQKKRLAFGLRNEEAKLNFALKNSNGAMADNSKMQIKALEKELGQLEKE